jgi:hypothetical protein
MPWHFPNKLAMYILAHKLLRKPHYKLGLIFA